MIKEECRQYGQNAAHSMTPVLLIASTQGAIDASAASAILAPRHGILRVLYGRARLIAPPQFSAITKMRYFDVTIRRNGGTSPQP